MTSEPVHQHWSSPVSTPSTTHHSRPQALTVSSPPFTSTVNTSATVAVAGGSIYHSPAYTTFSQGVFPQLLLSEMSASKIKLVRVFLHTI